MTHFLEKRGEKRTKEDRKHQERKYSDHAINSKSDSGKQTMVDFTVNRQFKHKKGTNCF